MKHLKLFENFQYKFPDLFFLTDKLNPEEIAYLSFLHLVYNQANLLDPNDIENYTKNDIEAEDYDGDPGGSLAIEITLYPKGEDDKKIEIFGDSNFTGGYTKFYAATFDSPAEGGDFYFTGIEIESLSIYTNDYEFDLINGEYTSDSVDKKMIISLVEDFVAERIKGDDERSPDPDEISNKELIPQKLMDKIEKIRKENPEIKRGVDFLGKFM